VTVNSGYLDFFRNWLHYAKRYLKDTERLVVVPEDDAAWRALQAVRARSNLPFVVVERGAEHPDPATPSTASTEVPLSLEYGSKDYGDLVWRRPRYILKWLRSKCTVLYVDIDTVWINDPFLSIGEKPGHGMYIAQDDPKPGGRSDRWYLCTCFLYAQPIKPVRQMMSLWSSSWNGHATRNQFLFNNVLKATGSAVDFVVLPIDQFPPGNRVSLYPGASVVHANWLRGHDAKRCFLKSRGLWAEGAGEDLEGCRDPKSPA